jgi:UDP-glucose 4-epimerase
MRDGRSTVDLVTGGAGYIGSHCCKALSEAGLVPVCLDNCSTGHPRFVKWGPAVKDDVRNTEAVLQAFRQHNVVAVMHFAASSAVGESVVNPEKYYTNNVLCEPVNPYGSSKLIERILSDYRSAYQMRSICFRYFNASRADSASHIGELRDPETHLIPRVMRGCRDMSRTLRCSVSTTPSWIPGKKLESLLPNFNPSTA